MEALVFCGMLLSVLVLLKFSFLNLWVRDFRRIENVFSRLKGKNQELVMLALVPCIYQKHLIWFSFHIHFADQWEILKLQLLLLVN